MLHEQVDAKQVNAQVDDTLTEEAKTEINKIKEIEKMIDRGKLLYRANEYTYDFRHFQATSTFGREICNGTIILKEADNHQSDLLVKILNFRKQINLKNKNKKQQKVDILKNLYNLFEGRKKVLNAFDSKIFPIKTKGTGFLNFDH